MLDWLKHFVDGRNQLASGGLLLMVVGSLGALMRSLPLRAWEWLVGQATMTVTVKDDDAAFGWVKEWLLEQRFLRRIRRVDLDTTLRGTELALMPAPGVHFFWYGTRPFTVTFSRSEDTQGRSQRRAESLTLRTLGRRQSFLRNLVAEIVACHHEKANGASRLYVYDEYWCPVEAYAPRLLESVILAPGGKEHLLADLQRFRASRERYRQLGVPYHRGYLLYGPPGTGKTSLVSSVAAHFGMSLYVINLAALSDKSLKSAMNDVPGNSVILFEDIDAMGAGKKRGEEPVRRAESKEAANSFGVTLAGLLNVLDGLCAPENVIFVMTTIHVEALDPALLRPGRIDYKLLLGEATLGQKVELYRRFFPGEGEARAREFARVHAANTMAEFQGLLLALEHDADVLERELATR